jgi:hypothetical protein
VKDVELFMIEMRMQRRIWKGSSEFPRNLGAYGAKKPVESPLAAERRKLRSTSHDSLKQEVNIGVTL